MLLLNPHPQLHIVFLLSNPIGEEPGGLGDELEGLLGSEEGRVLVRVEENCEFLVLFSDGAGVGEGFHAEDFVPIGRFFFVGGAEDGEGGEGFGDGGEVRGEAVSAVGVFES